MPAFVRESVEFGLVALPKDRLPVVNLYPISTSESGAEAAARALRSHVWPFEQQPHQLIRFVVHTLPEDLTIAREHPEIVKLAIELVAGEAAPSVAIDAEGLPVLTVGRIEDIPPELYAAIALYPQWFLQPGIDLKHAEVRAVPFTIDARDYLAMFFA